MRLVDADALEKEGWSLHRTIRVDKHTEEYQTKPLKQVPTIEPRKKGKWIYGEDYIGRDGWICDKCGHFIAWDYSVDLKSAEKDLPNFCPNCGADMREPEDIPMEYFESGGR